MTTHVVFELTVKDGYFDKVRDMLSGKIPETRSYAGNLGVDVVRDQDRPERVLFVEKWDARKSFEDYFAWRAQTGVLDALADMIDGPIDFRFFDRVEI